MNRIQAARARQKLTELPGLGLDRSDVFREASQLVRKVVAFDGASWHSHDPATLLMTGAYKHDMTSENFPLFAENENAQPDVNKFRDLGRKAPCAQTLFRATRGDLRQSARYREIFQSMGIEHELRASFREGGACWGSVALVRGRGRDDFTPGELAFIASVAPAIAEALRRAMLTSAGGNRRGAGHPGTVVIDFDHGIEMITSSAARWLAELEEPDAFPLASGAFPVALADAVAAARSSRERVARARVRTRSGQWLLLHASVTDGGDRRAAVIIEPAPASTVAPLLVAAYGLSEREREVTELVLRGYSTAEIASTLFITPYTVKDHLKSIFEKTSTRTRGELAARLFWQDCAPRMDTGLL